MLVTCSPLLETTLQAAKRVGISEKHILVMGLPGLEGNRDAAPSSVGKLITEGQKPPELEKLKLVKGHGEWQTAFISGVPVRRVPSAPTCRVTLTLRRKPS